MVVELIENPKIAFPFRLDNTGRGVRVHEQGSDDEIIDTVEVLLRTDLGEREGLPDFGIPAQEFRQGGASLEQLLESIRHWDDRAEVTMERAPKRLEELVDHIRVSVKGRGNA